MTDVKIMEECFLCKQPFQFGPHAYYGRYIPQWKIAVCDTCDQSNWDGVVPQRHPHLIEHLKAEGIEFSLNENGWLPLPTRGYS